MKRFVNINHHRVAIGSALVISLLSSQRTIAKPFFDSPHVRPIAMAGDQVLVVNTVCDTVDVFDRSSREMITRISVGVDPVSVTVRPDGREAWVANHVSDSVSVINLDRAQPTYLHVTATIQDLDSNTRSTRFDEPVGIAFASEEKAYVALSSENVIAVVDVENREVVKRLPINAQDPRAIVVRNGRLYVIPFESNNQTQLSGGRGAAIDGDLVTFDAWQHSIFHNNVLSLGHVVDIVKHPDVPDRDLFVFDTTTDELIETVDTLGTLLYGLDVDSDGNVFVAATDARNEANGRAGTRKHGLAELDNRAFLNRVTRVRFDGREPSADFFDLEPLPPEHPDPGAAMATPYGIKVSQDDETLFATAAASDRLMAMDARTGEIMGTVDVQAIPRGLAVWHDASRKPLEAWVLNAVENSISVVDVSDRSNLRVLDNLPLDNPTDPVIKQGRRVFESALTSTTKTFSCASCHPNGHTDQLLWVLKTPIVSGGDQIMPRSTMPVRGLRDTEPFHWDGIPGDPYGGNNSHSVHASVSPTSDIGDPLSSIRHLVDGGLANTMSSPSSPVENDEGKHGALDAVDRDAMSAFLLTIRYPPAQRRAYDDVVSPRAREGFELFHVDGDNDPGKPKPNVCGDCHRMPFLVSTNTPGTGMDAPTWRGAYDRFLILPQGRLNIIDFDFYAAIAEAGQDERRMWQLSWGGRDRFDPVWDMVLEGSTGCSGAYGRQWTMCPSNVGENQGRDLIAALERSANEGTVRLCVDGVMFENETATPIRFTYRPDQGTSGYVCVDEPTQTYSRVDLEDAVAGGRLIATWTARHRVDGPAAPQPALWTRGFLHQQRGRQDFPILYGDQREMAISGRHFGLDASVLVDGRLVEATVGVNGPDIKIELGKLPAEGMHLLQVSTPEAGTSNDFLFFVARDESSSKMLRAELDLPHSDLPGRLPRCDRQR